MKTRRRQEKEGGEIRRNYGILGINGIFRRRKAGELTRRDGIPGFFPDCFMSS
jgi:hypothetical protein